MYEDDTSARLRTWRVVMTGLWWAPSLKKFWRK